MGNITFDVVVQGAIEKRDYDDISYVNYWTAQNGEKIYKVYMKNKEALFLVDNSKFDLKHIPFGVNVVGEVIKREYL